MAVRTPVYWDTTLGGMREMTSTQITEIQNYIAQLYLASPNVTLSVVSSGGNLGTYNDTRLQAGAYLTSTTAYPPETSTAEPSTVTVGYSRISSSTSTQAVPSDTNSELWPMYYDYAGNLRSMTTQDMIDTFCLSAINTLISLQPYAISTASSLSGYTLVSSTVVFANTQANTGAYTAAGIPEALDQPTTLTNYYLHRRNSVLPAYTRPATFQSSTGSIIHPDLAVSLQQLIKYTASSYAGYKLSFNINGTGTNCGSGMADTKLNGAGLYTQYFVNADDYRAQEFPNGTAVTINTYYLRVTKV